MMIVMLMVISSLFELVCLGLGLGLGSADSRQMAEETFLPYLCTCVVAVKFLPPAHSANPNKRGTKPSSPPPPPPPRPVCMRRPYLFSSPCSVPLCDPFLSFFPYSTHKGQVRPLGYTNPDPKSTTPPSRHETNTPTTIMTSLYETSFSFLLVCSVHSCVRFLSFSMRTHGYSQ